MRLSAHRGRARHELATFEEQALKHGYGVTEEFLATLIEEIVSSRAPEKARLISIAREAALTEEQRESLRGVLSDELADTGLGPDDEPNERGRLIEAAIDWLGRR
jgi:hypothetical protein